MQMTLLAKHTNHVALCERKIPGQKWHDMTTNAEATLSSPCSLHEVEMDAARRWQNGMPVSLSIERVGSDKIAEGLAQP